MTERYTVFSEGGDEYRLQFTTDRSNIIAFGRFQYKITKNQAFLQ